MFYTDVTTQGTWFLGFGKHWWVDSPTQIGIVQKGEVSLGNAIVPVMLFRSTGNSVSNLFFSF